MSNYIGYVLRLPESPYLPQPVEALESTLLSLRSECWLGSTERKPKATLRLFCFPYAGGSASLYTDWARHLPAEVEVCPVHLPGRGSRHAEAPFTNLLSLVDVLAESLLPYLDQPFALLGHSMGALISFELARNLRRHNKILPVHLFLSGRRAPQLAIADSRTFQLPHDEFLSILRGLNGTPLELLNNPEVMELLLPMVRADFEAVQTYTYSPETALDCPISAWGGLEDRGVTTQQLGEWRIHTTRAFSLRMFSGDHFFVVSSQRRLLSLLRSELSQITAEIHNAPRAASPRASHDNRLRVSDEPTAFSRTTTSRPAPRATAAGATRVNKEKDEHRTS